MWGIHHSSSSSCTCSPSCFPTWKKKPGGRKALCVAAGAHSSTSSAERRGEGEHDSSHATFILTVILSSHFKERAQEEFHTRGWGDQPCASNLWKYHWAHGHSQCELLFVRVSSSAAATYFSTPGQSAWMRGRRSEDCLPEQSWAKGGDVKLEQRLGTKGSSRVHEFGRISERERFYSQGAQHRRSSRILESAPLGAHSQIG